MKINDDGIEAMGLDLVKVEEIATRLEEVAKDALKMGISIFGDEYGGGQLRYHDLLAEDEGPVILVKYIEGEWDGGDGSSAFADNIERGKA